MKPFLAHVKEWTIVMHRSPAGGGRPKVKWVKIVLQVPTGSWKVARSIGTRLGRHMRRGLPRFVTVGAASTGPCRMGVFCSEHNFVHGAEAEDLRERIEKLIEEGGDVRGEGAVYLGTLQRLLDDCDARDSLAFREISEREERRDG